MKPEGNKELANEQPVGMLLLAYWLPVAVPLAWGIWKTVLKLGALFQ